MAGHLTCKSFCQLLHFVSKISRKLQRCREATWGQRCKLGIETPSFSLILQNNYLKWLRNKITHNQDESFSEGKLVITASSMNTMRQDITCGLWSSLQVPFIFASHIWTIQKQYCQVSQTKRSVAQKTPLWRQFSKGLWLISFPLMLLLQLFGNWTATVGESDAFGRLLTALCYNKHERLR